jgi:hypothetical protein
LTKHIAVSAPASASVAAKSGRRLRTTPCSRIVACKAAWKVSHSETNPFKGGSAEMASAPIRK